MVTSFNYDIAPSIAERARKPSPFVRMTTSKAKIEHMIGSVRSHLDRLNKTLHADANHAAAFEVLAALRVLRSLKADVAEIERNVDQYTEALSEQVTAPRSKQ